MAQRVKERQSSMPIDLAKMVAPDARIFEDIYMITTALPSKTSRVHLQSRFVQRLVISCQPDDGYRLVTMMLSQYLAHKLLSTNAYLACGTLKNPENCYNTITGTASGNGKLSGKQFWIALGNCGTTSGGCGNIIFIPQPKTPKVEIKKVRLSADKLRPGY
jgi:hypothetical protein